MSGDQFTPERVSVTWADVRAECFRQLCNDKGVLTATPLHIWLVLMIWISATFAVACGTAFVVLCFVLIGLLPGV